MSLNKLPLAGNPKQGSFGQGELKQASVGRQTLTNQSFL